MSDLNNLAWILGCKIGFLPSSYLGISLSVRFKSKKVWNLVIEKIDERLDSWKETLLPKGGRLTLIKSALVNIPNYFHSLRF